MTSATNLDEILSLPVIVIAIIIAIIIIIIIAIIIAIIIIIIIIAIIIAIIIIVMIIFVMFSPAEGFGEKESVSSQTLIRDWWLGFLSGLYIIVGHSPMGFRSFLL